MRVFSIGSVAGPVKEAIQIVPLDINRLAHAVAIAETGNCTTGVGITHTNCFGIRYGGKWQKYDSPDDSYTDFKRIWLKSYKTFPTLQQAARWTGNDRVVTWRNRVKLLYLSP